jgi:hypothetical protein
MIGVRSKHVVHVTNLNNNNCTNLLYMCLSSGGIVSDYGLDDRAIGVRSLAEVKEYVL